ncbi:hypothetical protein GCK32_002429 [Trichostrongylus colubriformis]|uniref:Uncharacterized protein n=1 Tax=Trichostrongylus colubriformis TaxID=6319 RepID=A0AAN8EZ46_TRICO
MARTSGGIFRHDLQDRSEDWNGGRSRCSICGKGREFANNKDDTRRRFTSGSDEKREIGWATRERVSQHRRPTSHDWAEIRHRGSHYQDDARISRQASETSLSPPETNRHDNTNLCEDEYYERGLTKTSVIVYRDSRGRFARGPRHN